MQLTFMKELTAKCAIALSVLLLLLIPLKHAHASNEEVLALSQVVEQCVERHDTLHPVFHGCLDWHSSVHGHWALLWSAYRLQDSRLQALVEARLSSQAMEKALNELVRLDQRSGGNFELPYGRAWFLQLARDAQLLFKIDSPNPMAEYVFASLMEYARHGGGDIYSTSYNNAGWMFYQMVRWAQHRKDTTSLRELKSLIAHRYRNMKFHLPVNDNRGFFQPEALAALAIGSLSTTSLMWQTFMQGNKTSLFDSVSVPFPSPHQGGLNYSIAWGLWAMAGATQNSKYEQAALNHQQIMFESIESWKNDYPRYGHWVPQFGLFSDRMKSEFHE